MISLDNSSENPVLSLISKYLNLGEETPDYMMKPGLKYRLTEQKKKIALETPKEIQAQINNALYFYPSDWLKQAFKRPLFGISQADRAYFTNDGQIVDYKTGTIYLFNILDVGRGETSTVVHELGHLMEHSIPKIADLSQQFYNKRTKGETLEKLKDITGDDSYTDDEVTRKDNFANPYIGKWYGSLGSSEIISIGMEGVLFNSYDLWQKDPEHTKFMLGLILGVKV